MLGGVEPEPRTQLGALVLAELLRIVDALADERLRGASPRSAAPRPSASAARSGSRKITVRMSPTEVTLKPWVSDAHQWLLQRSTTCALGR